MCTLQGMQPISLLILGSVFSDCVVFCGDLAVSKLHEASRRCPAMTALRRRGRSELAGRNADESTCQIINCTELYKSIQLHRTLITPSPIGERSIVMSVCVCVCMFVSVSNHIFATTCPTFTKLLCVLSMAVTRSSSAGDTLCISGFMDR